MKKLFLILLTAIFFSSCATYPDVRPGEDGVHRVAISTDNVDDANRSAIRQANNYCDQSQKKAYFISESKKYTGDMDESTYNAGKRISKAAQVFGGGILVSSNDKGGQTTGKNVGLGGVAIDSAFGNGYTIEMSFKCR